MLRVFNTDGPNPDRSPYIGVVTIFAHALLREEAPSIFGDAEQRRDFVQVEDAVRGALGSTI